MNEILIILHFLGLGAGVASGVGNAVVGAQIAGQPDDRAVLGRLPPIFARVGHIGLGLLWATGLILIWTKYGGLSSLPLTFWAKLAGVVLLTVIIGVMTMRMRQMREGNLAAGAILPTLGRVNGLVLLGIIVLAVFAFSGVAA